LILVFRKVLCGHCPGSYQTQKRGDDSHFLWLLEDYY
jgi:hypothetical protein